MNDRPKSESAGFPFGTRPHDTDDLADVKGRLEQAGRQLDQFTYLSASVPKSVSGPQNEPPPDLADVISRLDRRLDQLIARGRSANDEIERRASAAGYGAADIDAERSAPLPQPAPDSATPLEQALMEIAERQHALEVNGGPAASRTSRADLLPRAPTQDLSRLEQQLRDITARFENLRPCGIEGAVETLRNDLAEIGVMLKEAMPRRAIEALESEVRGLSDRLQLNRQSETTDAAIAGVERGLAEIRDTLRGLTPAENLVGVDHAVKALSQKIDLIATDTQDVAALEQLENAIGALRGIVTHVASDGALAKLSDDVRALADKVERIASTTHSGTGLLSTLEHRIASIADALEARNVPEHAPPFDLDGVVKGLAEKLEQVGFARSDQTAVGHLEDRITSLIDKLDTSNARFNQLETIERGLADLIEEQRTQATRTEFAPPEVSELRRDVLQTQNSLQTVQGALTQLVDRLAVVEADLRSPSVLAPNFPMPFPPAAVSVSPAAVIPASTSSTIIHEAMSSPAPSVPGTSIATTGPDTQKSMSPAAQERRPIDPDLPPDHPLEPGAARARNGNSPVERIAASEAALGPVKPTAAPDSGSKSSFIAAARRAAQTANSEAATRTDKRTRMPAGKLASSGNPAWRDRVRKLLVAASVVAIVLGSLHLVASFFSSSDEPGDGSQTQPQQGNNRSDATDASNSNDASASGPLSPAPGSTMPQAPAAGRQSVLIPMGDGTSMAFSTGGVPAQPVRQLPVAPVQSGATQNVPARAAALSAAGNDVTGSIVQPSVAAPIVSTPELASVPSPKSSRQPSSDKLPAAIGGALRAAAAKGDPAAEFEIALRYTEGRGLPQNLAEAADWFDRAAKQGLAPAQFRLGGFYEKGLGVKKDLNTARRLYSAAAEAGNAKAMHNLAVLYAEGIDGKPDYPTATQWFRKAADYGLTDSQYNLGVLYARGIGVEVNLPEAFKWFTLAAREGDRESVLKRDDVGGRLDQASLASAKLAAQSFVPQRQPEAATQPAVPPGGWDMAAAVPPANPKSRNSGPKLDPAVPQAPR